jgi:hypothetical protein
METINEQLRDALLGHQVDLSRYSNDVVRRMVAILNKTDSDLAAQLLAALEKMPAESFTVQRLEQLLASVKDLNSQAYAELSKQLNDELRSFTDYEAGYQFQLFKTTLPVQVIAQVDVAMVSAEQVYSAAMARPFQGRILKEWAASIEQGRMTRIRDAVRVGYVENEPISKIVQRIRGTKAANYTDGIIEIDRHHAEAVVRSAISHTAAFTRHRFMKANSDLIKAVSWLSTLDSRTSEGCRIRDQLQYTADDAHKPIGHKIPWLAGPGALHWNCRSTSTPVVRSWKELGGADIEGFSPSTRASMDGQLPADLTYAEWIRKQSAARQDDILGATRGKLMREGGLTLDRFYSDKGRYLTIEELRQRDAEAFAKAGV